MEMEATLFALLGAYGISDRVDVGFALPVIRLAYRLRPLARLGGHGNLVGIARGLLLDHLALVGGQLVDLVERFDQSLVDGRADLEFAQNVFHVLLLRLAIRVGDVADVDDDVGFLHLLQGRAEGGDQLGRQVGDEADRVGQDDFPAGRQHDRAHGRIQRGEQLVLRENVRAGHGVEQRRLAGVRIADDGDARVVAAPFPLRGALAIYLLEALLERRDALSDQPPVGFDLRFTRSLGSDAALLARKVRPLPRQPRSQVFQLSQFHLRLRHRGFGAGGKDVHDQYRPIEHLTIKPPL